MSEKKIFLSDVNREDSDESWTEINVCRAEITPELIEKLEKAVEITTSAKELFKGSVTLRIGINSGIEFMESTDQFCETDLMDYIIGNYRIVGEDDPDLSLLDPANEVSQVFVNVYPGFGGSVEFGCTDRGDVRYRSTNILISELKKAIAQ